MWTVCFIRLSSSGQKDTGCCLASSGSKFSALGKKLKWKWPEAVLPSASPLAQDGAHWTRQVVRGLLGAGSPSFL